MHDATMTSNSSSNGDVVANNSDHDKMPVGSAQPPMSQEPVPEAPPNPAPPSEASTSETSSSPDHFCHTPESVKLDREYFEQMPDSDPLVQKLARHMVPMEGIYEQMAGILKTHLTEHPQIASLQETSREFDLLLQYSKQIGRLQKFEHDLRVNRDKIDRAKLL